MIRLREHNLLQCDKGIDTNAYLSIVSNNARSLHKHVEYYRKDTRLSDIDVLVIQKTWAKNTDPKSHYKLEGFHDPVCVFTNTTLEQPRSGTFVYVNTKIYVVSTIQISKTDIEGLSIVISKNDHQCELAVVYCHPPGKTIPIWNALKTLVKHTGRLPFIITRDFNIDHLQHSKHRFLSQFISEHYKAEPVIHQETTDYHTALDQIYTTAPNTTTAGVYETHWSDHDLGIYEITDMMFFLPFIIWKFQYMA